MKVFNIQMNIDQHNPNNNYATAERWIRKAHEEGADYRNCGIHRFI